MRLNDGVYVLPSNLNSYLVINMRCSFIGFNPSVKSIVKRFNPLNSSDVGVLKRYFKIPIELLKGFE